MGIHRILHEMYEAGYAKYITASAQSISCIQWGEVFEVTTTGSSDTLTLLAPTKPGIVCAVVLNVDAGDLTLTVTDGYNADDDTSVTFGDAGDFLILHSIAVGGSYYWRVVAQEGTNASVEDLAVDTLTVETISPGSAVTAEHGAGAIGTGVAPATYRYTRDGDIITEIQVDLTGLGCVGTAAKDAIGLAAGDPAYIGRYVTATCGIVYRVELICLEAPGEGTATITSDIDLGAEDVGTTEYDDPVDDVVVNTGGLAAGESYVNDAPGLTANDYLYLIEGDTAATTGVYDAGQVLVRLTGRPLLT